MPVSKTEIDVAQEVINVLLGDKQEAEAYSENPQGWLDGHGYEGVSAEALAECGTGYGAGASASASAGAGGGAYPPPAGASAVAQLDYIVYNNYVEDNDIINNIENHGNLDFQQVVGDDNITQGDGGVIGQAQTGEGNVQVGAGANVSGNIEAGEGDQLVDQSETTASSVFGDAQAGSAGGDVTQTQSFEQPAPEEEAPPEDPPDPVL